MRDPDGSIQFIDDKVIRRINAGVAAKQFLTSKAASALVNRGQLVPYVFTAPDTLESPRLPFISYPFEWCDAHLHLAGQLTLDISRHILSDGYELKDASAWNVIFQGNRPVFCDHLSFQPITTSQWWAFGQFVRQFLLPLVVSKKRGLKPHQSYSTFRDGIQLDTARELLGLSRYLTRYWPLMLGSKRAPQTAVVAPLREGKSLHGSLYGFSQFLLNGGKPNRTDSHWADYTNMRYHYTDVASTEKRIKVAEWLENTKPKWVVDLGCNTGEFTKLAAETGADVIAIDLDHDSIQKLVLSSNKTTNIHPLVSNLGDMVGGRGWCGDEFPSLMTRLHHHADMVMMLALTHHLAISEGVYLQKIAQMAARITREFAIVEMLDETDPMVQRLCGQRQRNPSDFSVAAQLEAFGQYFSTVASYAIPNTLRTLCLLKKI
ncbi:class I SAM-dependent methyltransferase [Novosphingobium sp.]|uniref:class I SAM-dependent methyltransferase n=1 Tax=Novosphingobium sp. TaxID=1874826 RepID=UPI0022C3B5E7|nr:class I SAM-dependent methyltransferase [Novosphingobium sp.]MCZ8074551.1 class I SAM-dependent methyltransferase [Roseateles sp.]MCZ8233513.1 class I SAM-dependent methyltransferase [Novosphingobium sp.]MCZ8265179.1 class I SAM-dependent methyltransferase [Novosphingobium sp.]MCZ8305045.1 class I SAM-dependent methyltransferase [Novosphingobium sp.]